MAIETGKIMRIKQKIKKRIQVVATVLLLAPLAFLMLRAVVLTNSLRRHPVLTTASVTHYYPDHKKNGGSFAFTYQVDGKTYEGETGIASLFSDRGYDFVGKTLPIVYDSTNVEMSMLLITPGGFKEYKLPFPDSLKWTRKYFRR